ncbi:hypothetical protein NDU88_000317 [Pleurodeles waltl]|uniref:Uncharacterized protein n=1 Tax=Pleurodeles waltl TaxID=8319 RepID=A0AAV7KLW4_PLEWA|nr:hypothetical protein NDU88_000317 [Pleurodeles waltl]
MVCIAEASSPPESLNRARSSDTDPQWSRVSWQGRALERYGGGVNSLIKERVKLNAWEASSGGLVYSDIPGSEGLIWSMVSSSADVSWCTVTCPKASSGVSDQSWKPPLEYGVQFWRPRLEYCVQFRSVHLE